MLTIYTLFSYEDNEIKALFKNREQADQWVKENREGNEYDVKIEEWQVDFT